MEAREQTAINLSLNEAEAEELYAALITLEEHRPVFESVLDELEVVLDEEFLELFDEDEDDGEDLDDDEYFDDFSEDYLDEGGEG
jgi:hypothetical protein